MIVDQGKYYLYRHIRPDKNEPFYIGIGTKRNYSYSHDCMSEKYHRSRSKQRRKKIWTDIVKKNNGVFDVEIIMESNNYEFIKTKEIEFIALYGRINLGTGTLANLTNGGEGTVGYSPDKYVTSKEVFVYDKEGCYICSYKSTQDAAKNLKVDRGGISSVSTGKTKHLKQLRFYYAYQGEKILNLSVTKNSLRNEANKKSKATVKMDKNFNIIETLPSLREYCRKYGYKSSNICKAVKTGNKYKGYYWKYK